MPAPAPFSFTTHAIDPRLRPWIRSAWEFAVGEGAPPAHHVPPDGLAFVVMVERGPAPPLIVACGPQIEPLVIPTTPGARYRGLRLAPESVASLTGVPVGVLVRGSVPVERLGPVSAVDIARALAIGEPHRVAAAIESLFLPVLTQLPPPDALVTAALELIRSSRGHMPVTEVAAILRLAPRTLLRRVRAATGLAPKQHARIARFIATAHRMLDPDHRLSDLAAQGGYADQPHFHHEVAALTGLTPRELSDRVRRTAHHLGD